VHRNCNYQPRWQRDFCGNAIALKPALDGLFRRSARSMPAVRHTNGFLVSEIDERGV